MGASIVSLLDSALGGGGSGPLIFKGDINVAADFPSLAEVRTGWWFQIKSDVTDNDPTKTNTGQAFKVGDQVVWNGTDWSDLSGIEVWADNGTDVKTINDPRNVDLQSAGLKDNNATIAVLLADASNTSYNTTNKTIIGAVNELLGAIPLEQFESFIGTAAQTIFTILGPTPSAPTKVMLAVNGQLREEGVGKDFTISGNTITWTPNDYTIQAGDLLQLWYME